MDRTFRAGDECELNLLRLIQARSAERIETLEAALRRARDDMTHWGGYVPAVYRDRVAGDLAAINRALRK